MRVEDGDEAQERFCYSGNEREIVVNFDFLQVRGRVGECLHMPRHSPTISFFFFIFLYPHPPLRLDTTSTWRLKLRSCSAKQ